MPRTFGRRRVRFVILVGTVVILSVAAWQIYSYLLSFDGKFRRSKPALDAYAATVLTVGPSVLASPPSQIGHFRVLSAQPLPHGFVLESDYGNPFDWNGLAYSTVPLQQFDKDANGKVTQVFTVIQGNWYTVFRP